MSEIQIIKPETVTHAEKQAEKQRQLERRGIAREFLQHCASFNEDLIVGEVKTALKYADELLAQTKVTEP